MKQEVHPAWQTIPDLGPEEEELWQAVNRLCDLLDLASSLPALEKKTVACWIAGTYFLAQLDKYPILSTEGPTGTGKSYIHNVIASTAYKPYRLTAPRMSQAAIRDTLIEAYQGTAIIEEADEYEQAQKLEELLTLRYSRAVALSGKMEEVSEHKWEKRVYSLFGATALHRRAPVFDAALESRIVLIRTKPDIERNAQSYEEISPEHPWAQQVRAWLEKSKLAIPKKVDLPNGHAIAARILDTYQPIVALAELIKDYRYLRNLFDELSRATEALANGQAYEINALLLQALVAVMTKGAWGDDSPELVLRSVAISELKDWLKHEHDRVVSDRQASRILRDFGFKVERLGGRNRIEPNIATLAKALKSYGIVDPVVERAFERAKQKVQNMH